MKTIPCFDDIEIFEWYDGLVLGLTRAEDTHFLACLLAFDPDTKRKQYLLASLSQEQTNQLRALFQKHGPQAFNRSALSEIVTQNANLYLTSTEPEKNKQVTLKIIDAAQRVKLQDLSFPLIDVAVSPSAISQWLDD